MLVLQKGGFLHQSFVVCVYCSNSGDSIIHVSGGLETIQQVVALVNSSLWCFGDEVLHAHVSKDLVEHWLKPHLCGCDGNFGMVAPNPVPGVVCLDIVARVDIHHPYRSADRSFLRCLAEMSQSGK